MKILYLSPEHITGTLKLFCQGHAAMGNYARYVTMFPTPYEFPEDLCLNLPLHPDKSWIAKGRSFLQRLRGIPIGFQTEGNPPFWSPGGIIDKWFFKTRDFLIKKKVFDFIEQHGLWEYDIYHLEQGLDFFRDSRLAKKLKSIGKKIVCFYHGNDVRNRGVIPEIHEISDLNLTSEFDLLEKYPGIKYLFLPIDTNQIVPVHHKNNKIKITHATRSRMNKGSDYIIDIVRKLKFKFPVELVLMETVPHKKCMELKAESDIYIDQIADRGGWGYGMNSVESLALGVATCTFLNEKYLEFIPDHPFVNVNYNNLEFELTKLINDKAYRQDCADRGRKWVIKKHDINVVMEQLYIYYREIGVN